jgi:hypothetical protein
MDAAREPPWMDLRRPRHHGQPRPTTDAVTGLRAFDENQEQRQAGVPE